MVEFRRATARVAPATIGPALTGGSPMSGGAASWCSSQGAPVADPRCRRRCYTSAEVAGLNSALQAARDHHMTVVSSTGDLGVATHACSVAGSPVKAVGLYAAGPLVLAVGGTSLEADPVTGAYISETAWNEPGRPSSSSARAQGGRRAHQRPARPCHLAGSRRPPAAGFSHLFPRPTYQDGVPGAGATRGLPDDAASLRGAELCRVPVGYVRTAWRSKMTEGRQSTFEMALTHFIVSRDVERSVRFYTEVLGGTTIRSGEPSYVALANSWIIINVGGGPTDDKPTVTLEAPPDLDRTSAFLNIRVSDIQAAYAEWTARGAEFLTPPKVHQTEMRCYIRDPDGHLIEVGQTTLPGGWSQFLTKP